MNRWYSTQFNRDKNGPDPLEYASYHCTMETDNQAELPELINPYRSVYVAAYALVVGFVYQMIPHLSPRQTLGRAASIIMTHLPSVLYFLGFNPQALGPRLMTLYTRGWGSYKMSVPPTQTFDQETFQDNSYPVNLESKNKFLIMMGGFTIIGLISIIIYLTTKRPSNPDTTQMTQIVMANINIESDQEEIQATIGATDLESMGKDPWDDIDKVKFLVKQLSSPIKGKAIKMLKEHPDFQNNYNLLCKALTVPSKDSQNRTAKQHKFFELYQGDRSVCEYADQFSKLLLHIDIGEETACFLFKKGLNGYLKNAVGFQSLPDNLEDLIKKIIALEADKKHMRNNKQNLLTGPAPKDDKEKKNNNNNNNLTNNNCLSCGEAGHYARKRPSKETIVNNNINLGANQGLSLIPISFNVNLKIIQTWALIDTGAQANFIDEKIIKLLGKEKGKSIQTKLANTTINKANEVFGSIKTKIGTVENNLDYISFKLSGLPGDTGFSVVEFPSRKLQLARETNHAIQRIAAIKNTV